MVGEENTVEVVLFVLDDSGGKVVEFLSSGFELIDGGELAELFVGESQVLEGDPLMPIDWSPNMGNG